MNGKLISEKIRVADAKPLKHSVLFRNDTSGTSITDLTQISLIELLPSGLVLEVPIHSCKTGHMVTLFIFESSNTLKTFPNLSSKNIHQKIKNVIDVIGKIQNIIPGDGFYKENVTILFSQFDEIRWKILIDGYIKNQEIMDKLVDQKKL